MPLVKQPFLVAYEAYNQARHHTGRNPLGSYMTFGDFLSIEDKENSVELSILYKHYVPLEENRWGFDITSPVKNFLYKIFVATIMTNLPIKFIYESSSGKMYIVCERELYNEIAPLCVEV